MLLDFGFPMGPFQMSDLAGLDIGWDPDKSNGAENFRDALCEAGLARPEEQPWLLRL